MPRGVPKNGKRKKRGGSRRFTVATTPAINGVTTFNPDARLLLTLEKSAGRPKVMDLGDRWAILTLPA